MWKKKILLLKLSLQFLTGSYGKTDRMFMIFNSLIYHRTIHKSDFVREINEENQILTTWLVDWLDN